MSQSTTTSRPHVPNGAHPIYTGKYLLPTPPLSKLCDHIRRWLDMRAPGAMVEGPQRFGKTRSIKFSIKELKHTHGDNFPVFSFDCRDYRFPSDSVFFGDILDDLGHSLSRSGTAAARRTRLIQYLCSQAAETDHRRLVLIADEAQNLRQIHYKWLVDVYNELERKDIIPTMILVGQPELVHQRDAFDQAKQKQIVGRFMVHHHHFNGLRSASDLKYCLKGYDEGSEYPELSGWSFTRYFFPHAFDSGWRLTGQDKMLWLAFQDIRAEAQLPGKAELPMQYVARTIEYVLRQFSNLDDHVAPLSLNQWKEAIVASGYCDAGRYL